MDVIPDTCSQAEEGDSPKNDGRRGSRDPLMDDRDEYQ